MFFIERGQIDVLDGSLVVVGEPPPERRSIEQLRGMEGVRVRETYPLPANARD